VEGVVSKIGEKKRPHETRHQGAGVKKKSAGQSTNVNKKVFTRKEEGEGENKGHQVKDDVELDRRVAKVRYRLL